MAPREAAAELIELVGPDRRRLLRHPWESPERTRWQYTPGPRPGLALADMDEVQRNVALGLLRTGLSERGFATTWAVMALESVLRHLEEQQGRPGYERRHPLHYLVRDVRRPSR